MIYCVEDDKDIREIELYTLKSLGFEAMGFMDATSFLYALVNDPLPSLVLLDVMLPDLDGVEVLKKIRRDVKSRHLPVIMATARGAEYEKISALDLGADDYLTKPFSMMEMVARVRAVLRRCQIDPHEIIETDGLKIDVQNHTVYKDGVDIELTRKEFDMLILLMLHPGRVYSRETLLDRIWGLEYDGENRTVDVHIRTLRQKLQDKEYLIKTIRGVGYKAEF